MIFYTEYITNNNTLAQVLFAYCEGKNFLWNVFFGWKHTRIFLGENVYTFVIPTRKVEELENIAFSFNEKKGEKNDKSNNDKNKQRLLVSN